MATPRKATAVPAQQPAVEAGAGDVTAAEAQDPQQPDETAGETEAQGGEFCPTPGDCFPDGLPEEAVTAGCVHGQWILTG